MPFGPSCFCYSICLSITRRPFDSEVHPSSLLEIVLDRGDALRRGLRGVEYKELPWFVAHIEP
jgi:hypothetical protein